MKITKIDVQNGESIDKISFVKFPANKDNINLCSLQFCAKNIEDKTIDVILVRALQKIYRNNPERFYYFTIDGLKRLSNNTDFKNMPFTENHDNNNKLNGISIINEELTTNGDYPLELTATLKVDNPELWTKINSGDINGVSIETTVVETELLNITDASDFFNEIEKLDTDTKRDILLEFDTYNI